MQEIIDDLRKILYKIELRDDPTADEVDREPLGRAHYFVEECINNVSEI